MSVDMFWRRVSPNAIPGLGPRELRRLVPHWFDDRFRQETTARITVGVEDTGALIGELLRLGAGDSADARAGWLAVDGADGLRRDHVGVLTPEQVATIAEYLARARPAVWMRQFRPGLAVAARKLGYRRPFDDAWARSVLTDTEELAALFQRAAAAQEAVIVAISG